MQHRDSAGLKKNKNIENCGMLCYVGMCDVTFMSGKSIRQIKCLSGVLVPVSVLDNIFMHFSLLSNNPKSGTAKNTI